MFYDLRLYYRFFSLPFIYLSCVRKFLLCINVNCVCLMRASTRVTCMCVCVIRVFMCDLGLRPRKSRRNQKIHGRADGRNSAAS